MLKHGLQAPLPRARWSPLASSPSAHAMLLDEIFVPFFSSVPRSLGCAQRPWELLAVTRSGRGAIRAPRLVVPGLGGRGLAVSHTARAVS